MSLEKAKKIIASVKGSPLTTEERAKRAVELASNLLTEALQTSSANERSLQDQLALMMEDPHGKAFFTSMTDQCFRSQKTKRMADQLHFLLQKFGIPHFLGTKEKVGLHLFNLLGKWFPTLFVPAIKFFIRKKTATVILPGEPPALHKHMLKRKRQGVKVNLNHLGEAILGEEEALHRLQIYLNDLANPDIEYVSIKISTICSQLNLLAWHDTLQILSQRLRLLYRTCLTHHKFVNLDMEEYRDLRLTVDLFRSVLDEPEFYSLPAGIVLQSYLPDSYLVQQELTVWAMQRLANGGAPIKIRLVKGANLAMEQVEASLRGWPQAPYTYKTHVDANFKRMLDYACQPEHARAARIGIGSHNLFDISYALLLRAENHVETSVSFEMLEGMAEPMRRVVQEITGGMLLYCPAAAKSEFQNAVAYLMRRLDENTAPENFLRYAFGMEPGSLIWEDQAKLFLQSCTQIPSVSYEPSRTQNRLVPLQHFSRESAFINESDTDWSLPPNRLWGERILTEWSKHTPCDIPLVFGGKTFTAKENQLNGFDPSYPDKPAYKYNPASWEQAEQALECAQKAQKSWEAKTPEQRAELLARIADLLRKRRQDLIGVMVYDTGKTIPEADVEVSEAIDFADYYRFRLLEAYQIADIQWKPKGVVLVAPPWNFPCSIPAGGILASLAAGNAVIFKPAPEAVYVGWILANLFWQAGIPQEALQFLPCEDDPVGTKLIQDQRLDAVILTGATATARKFIEMRPGLDLMAETGGKNAIIVTAMADRDLAVRDIVQSAFGHAGQKCSACSLVICEREVYEDPQFLAQLKDAAASLQVGTPWNPKNKVNPLIREPGDALLRALTTLEPGETWLLQPIKDAHNPQLWSPGIKMGVQPGSFTHLTEFFGPLLGVMCADHLEQAIHIANQTPYGLTSGLHSLDEREHEIWLKSIVAGNLYINRGITGAVVQRQPFGGCKASGFGPGAKAGGPNYLLQLMHAAQVDLPIQQAPAPLKLREIADRLKKQGLSAKQEELWEASIGSYSYFWEHHFSQRHDPSQVRGQDNLFCYAPQSGMSLRVQTQEEIFDAARVLAAAQICGVQLEVSVDASVDFPFPNGIVESEERWLSRPHHRVRFVSKPSIQATQALALQGTTIIHQPVHANGRIELLTLLREIAISYDYHRYGNIESDRL